MVTLASFVNGRPGLAIICIVAMVLGGIVLTRYAKEWRQR